MGFLGTTQTAQTRAQLNKTMETTDHKQPCACGDCRNHRREAALNAAKELPSARRSAADCSGSSFEWITPEDPRWEHWRAWDEKILVMTSEGPVIVRVPENGYPWYHCFDDEELAEPEEWTAWSRIPHFQNSVLTQPDIV